MSSTGETSLSNLLRTLTVTISPTTYTFLTLPPNHNTPITISISAQGPSDSNGIQMLFHEPSENRWTLIIDNAFSETLKTYQIPGSETSPTQWRMLTLNVQSSLDAVGFMAVVSKALGEAGVSANVVAGYLHDHVFVQEDRVEKAKEALERVREDANKVVASDQLTSSEVMRHQSCMGI